MKSRLSASGLAGFHLEMAARHARLSTDQKWHAMILKERILRKDGFRVNDET